MPIKARYWKDPEKHRKDSLNRRKKLIKLGYKGGLRNIATYLRFLSYCKNYWKDPKNKPRQRATQKRIRDKIRKAGFPVNAFGRYFYHRSRKANQSQKARLKDANNRIKKSS